MGSKPRWRIGIREVAAAAGVSPTTVSHALSGKGRLNQATRERIERIAGELGYRPNPSARNLASRRTGLLGITVSTNPETPMGLGDFDYFIQLLSAATGAAVEHGLALVVDGGPPDGTAFRRVDIEGAIVVDPLTDDPLLEELESHRIPTVTTGRRDDRTESKAQRYWVDNDHRAATITILDHLATAGARRIGLVATAPVTSYSRDVLDAYTDWCDLGDQEPMIAMAEGAINEGSGFRAAGDLLDRLDRPDAIFASLDQLALGALLAARARSFAVPEDLMIAGYTDSRASALADPPLTVVGLNPEQIGRAAVTTLAAVIEGREPESNPTIVPTEVIARRSTARRPR